MVPAIAMVAAQYAPASEVQTLEQAQQRLYPGLRLTPADFKLSPEQFAQLKAEYKVPSFRPAVKAWRVEGGGWLFLDQVYGLNDVVTYLVGINDDGRLRGIEVLSCADGYCDMYDAKSPWRARLMQVTHGRWDPVERVPVVAGATQSCTHVAEGVKKMLAIHARFLPGP
ncbi:MAG: FMN-binding protein [Gammaproteobacteria bacterium]|nr:FMN-binding protein [Gammaproteobacteria bacterium]